MPTGPRQARPDDGLRIEPGIPGITRCAIAHLRAAPDGASRNYDLLLPDPSLGARLQSLDVFAVYVEQQQGQHDAQRGESGMAEPPQENRRDKTRNQR